MSSGRVYSDIPRLPREPKLEGPPHSAGESVFNQPGMVDAAGMASDFLGANSAKRRIIARELIRSLSAESSQSLTNGLQLYTSPKINDSDILRNAGNSAIEALAKHGVQPETDTSLWESNPAVDPFAKELIPGSIKLIKLASEVTECAALSKKDRTNYIRNKAKELLEDPWEMERQMTAAALYGDSELTGASPFLADISNYSNAVGREILDQAGDLRFNVPDQKTLYGWLVLHHGVDYSEELSHSAFTKQVAEKHLKGLVSRCTTPNSVIDTLHAIAVAGLTNGKKEIIKHTLDILIGSTAIMPSDTPQFYDYSMSALITTGESKTKAMEIQSVRSKYFAAFAPGKIGSYGKIARRTARAPAYKRHTAMRVKQKQQQMGEHAAQADAVALAGSLFNPSRLMRHLRAEKRLNNGQNGGSDVLDDVRGPLTDFLDEATLHTKHGYRFNPKKQRAYIAFPGSSEVVELPQSSITEHVRRQVHAEWGRQKPLEARKYWNTLAYLLPGGVTKRQLEELSELNADLRRRMANNQVHTLSPRGDKVEIVDPMLRELGFSSVTYSMAKSDKSKIDVAVTVGSLTYKARLLADYELATNDEGDFYLPQAGELVRNVVLSHLHEVVCTDDVGETSEHGDMVEQRKAFSTRRAHRRVLPDGKKPTTKQIVKVNDEYGIDLIKRNRERIEEGENSMITWVSQVDAVAIGGKGPVVSRAPNATKELQEVFKYAR